MRTSNPALKTDTFIDSARGALRSNSSDVMTIDGAVNKTGILAFILVCSAAFVLSLAYKTTGYGEAPAIMQNSCFVMRELRVGYPTADFESKKSKGENSLSVSNPFQMSLLEMSAKVDQSTCDQDTRRKENSR